MVDSLIDAALRLAEGGRPVFPCGANKAPLTQHGFKSASLDPATIGRWWGRWPDALIGVPTGAPSGLLVLDLDVKNGNDGINVFEALRAGRGLPPHPLVRTGSGGLHLYFAVVPGRRVGSSAGRIAPGVDVRGDGGYAVVPPSPGYALVERVPLHPPPAWLLDLMDPPPPLRAPAHGARFPRDVGATERLTGLIVAIRTAPEGRRHDILFWASCRAGEMVGRGEADGHAAAAALAQATMDGGGRDRRRAEATARDGILRGMAECGR
jgi:hypothetical protein